MQEVPVEDREYLIINGLPSQAFKAMYPGRKCVPLSPEPYIIALCFCYYMIIPECQRSKQSMQSFTEMKVSLSA